MADRYYNPQTVDDDGVFEDNDGNDESLDAVNISTPGAYGVNT